MRRPVDPSRSVRLASNQTPHGRSQATPP